MARVTIRVWLVGVLLATLALPCVALADATPVQLILLYMPSVSNTGTTSASGIAELVMPEGEVRTPPSYLDWKAPRSTPSGCSTATPISSRRSAASTRRSPRPRSTTRMCCRMRFRTTTGICYWSPSKTTPQPRGRMPGTASPECFPKSTTSRCQGCCRIRAARSSGQLSAVSRQRWGPGPTGLSPRDFRPSR